MIKSLDSLYTVFYQRIVFPYTPWKEGMKIDSFAPKEIYMDVLNLYILSLVILVILTIKYVIDISRLNKLKHWYFKGCEESDFDKWKKDKIFLSQVIVFIPAYPTIVIIIIAYVAGNSEAVSKGQAGILGSGIESFIAILLVLALPLLGLKSLIGLFKSIKYTEKAKGFHYLSSNQIREIERNHDK